jgi:two-component sensor histidine kinase
VVPVARSLAEIRGLLNQALRRLERLEQQVLAERSARIDDLALVVELVSSGWQGVDTRLARLEQAGGAVIVPLRAEPAAAIA